jgi:hypothetical protein
MFTCDESPVGRGTTRCHGTSKLGVVHKETRHTTLILLIINSSVLMNIGI